MRVEELMQDDRKMIDYRALLQDVVALAKVAGDAIMRVYERDDFETEHKSDDSPLTIADMASHNAIIDGLTVLTPDISIISEESVPASYLERSSWRRFWLIDPLDGTKEFIKRNGEFTVNIALIENGVPTLGVVYAPVLKTCYYAASDLGAFVQRAEEMSRSIAVQSCAIGQRVRVVASRSHCDVTTQALLNRLGDCELVSMGSSLKLCLVAEGRADFYPRLAPTMEWDTAAAHVVVNSAGGVVCDVDGVPLHYNKQDMHNPYFLVMPAADSPFLEITRSLMCGL